MIPATIEPITVAKMYAHQLVANGVTHKPPCGAGTPIFIQPTIAPPTAEPTIHDGITCNGSAVANGIAPSVMNENPRTQLVTPA